MCVQWHHRCCDKPFDEGATRYCIWKKRSQFLCIIDGGVDLGFLTLSANVTESAAWLEVTFPDFYSKCTVNIESVSIADYLVAEVWLNACRRATVTWEVEQCRIPIFVSSVTLFVSLLCLSLQCTGVEYTSVHILVTHMRTHLPYDCHPVFVSLEWPASISSWCHRTVVDWPRDSTIWYFMKSHPFNAANFALLTLDQYACLNPLIYDSGVSRSDRLINWSSYHCLQPLVAWHRSTLINFLSPTRSEAV